MCAQLWGYAALERARVGTTPSIGAAQSRVQKVTNLLGALPLKVERDYNVHGIHRDIVGAPFREEVVVATISRKDGAPITCDAIAKII